MIRKIAVSSFVVILFAAMMMLEPASSSAADQKKPFQKDSMTPAAATQGVPSAAAVGMPDLVISNIHFQVVQNKITPSGADCQIYNVIATVKNQGTAAAKPFNVIIERYKPVNTFELACQTCTIPVAGLDKGASKTLDARQFNNCSEGIANTFRVTADPTSPAEPKGKVIESNENNNAKTAKHSSPKPGSSEEKKPGY